MFFCSCGKMKVNILVGRLNKRNNRLKGGKIEAKIGCSVQDIFRIWNNQVRQKTAFLYLCGRIKVYIIFCVWLNTSLNQVKGGKIKPIVLGWYNKIQFITYTMTQQTRCQNLNEMVQHTHLKTKIQKTNVDTL